MEWSGILQSAFILWDLSIPMVGAGVGGWGGGVGSKMCINFASTVLAYIYIYNKLTYFPVHVRFMSVSLVDHYEYELLLCPTAIFLSISFIPAPNVSKEYICISCVCNAHCMSVCMSMCVCVQMFCVFVQLQQQACVRVSCLCACVHALCIHD